MSYLLPRYLLLQAGLLLADLPEFGAFGDHTNIVLAVLAGEYAAGAVKEDIFFSYQPRGLRAIATTPAISDHLFIASNTLDAKTVEAIRNAMHTLAAQSVPLLLELGPNPVLLGLGRRCLPEGPQQWLPSLLKQPRAAM